MRALFTLLAFLAIAPMATAQPIDPRPGWVVMPTEKPFDVLLEDLRAAVSAEGFGVVTQAGPTGAARARGIDIPENRVIGVFNNVYAVRILSLSPAAMIEAPVRFYLTETPGGGTTLSYKTPGFIFAPYIDEGGPELAAAAAELDAAFRSIANAAVE